MTICALRKFIRLIDGQNLRPMRQWSTRSLRDYTGVFWCQLRRDIRRILNLLSGNEIVKMLQSLCLMFFVIA